MLVDVIQLPLSKSAAPREPVCRVQHAELPRSGYRTPAQGRSEASIPRIFELRRKTLACCSINCAFRERSLSRQPLLGKVRSRCRKLIAPLEMQSGARCCGKQDGILVRYRQLPKGQQTVRLGVPAFQMSIENQLGGTIDVRKSVKRPPRIMVARRFC